MYDLIMEDMNRQMKKQVEDSFRVKCMQYGNKKADKEQEQVEYKVDFL